MLSIIISYITKWLYGEPHNNKQVDNTFVFVPTTSIKSIEHLNQIKNFEFKKNRHYYFKSNVYI